jgi:DNA-binding CsgD family transcriptional regulator
MATVEWPLVGRQMELRRIAHAASDRNAAGFVIGGPAGVGKSRVLLETIRNLQSPKFRVLEAVASVSSRTIPFGALAHLLPGQTATPAPVNLVGWAREGLLRAADGFNRLVVAVDDAHLLDEASASVVLNLARTGNAFVLATVRDGERAPDPVLSLWKDGVVDRLELAALTFEETAEAVHASLRADVATATVNRLWRLTEGNPLFLRELVIAGVTTGALAETSGIYRWDGKLPSTTRLQEVIEARLGKLSTDEAAALEILAFGEPVGLDMLTQLASVEAVEAVESRGLVSVSKDGRRVQVRLAHPLYGEIVRSKCPEVRGRRRMRQLAGAVEAVGVRRREDVLRLALWRLDSGTGHDARLLLSACRIAWAANDMPLATRLGWASLNAGGGVDAAITLATILNFTERPDEATAALDGVPTPDKDDAQFPPFVATRAFTLHYGHRRPDAALQLLDDALGSIRVDQARLALAALKTEVLTAVKRCSVAMPIIDEILNEPAASPGTIAQAHVLAAHNCAATGRYATACAHLDSAESSIQEWRSEAPMEVGRIPLVRHVVHIFKGDLIAAEELVTPLRKSAMEAGNWDLLLGFSNWYLGQSARYRGQVRRAAQLCREALAAWQFPQSVSVFAGPCLGDLAHAVALTGNHAKAEALLRDARSARSISMEILNHWVDLAAPWVAASAGRLSAAIDLAVETSEVAATAGFPGVAVIAAHDAVRLGDPKQVAAWLQGSVSEADGPFAQICLQHALCATSKDPHGLLEVSDNFGRLGMNLFAAEAAAQAGALLRSTQQAGRARAADTRAWFLLRNCEGARTPALTELRAPGLTKREHEIAQLAATGLTSRQIASNLVTSVRTVDNHLHSVFSKLGVSDRTELAGLLAEPPQEAPAMGT